MDLDSSDCRHWLTTPGVREWLDEYVTVVADDGVPNSGEDGLS